MTEINQKKGMRLIILDILSRENLHGYGISEKIEEIYGIKKPSSGIIYPALSNLRKRGLIKLCKEGKREKKVYEITEKGLKYLEEHKWDLERIKRTLHNLGDFHQLGGHEMMENIHKLIKNLHKLSDEEKEKLSKILKDTSKDISELLEGKYYE